MQKISNNAVISKCGECEYYIHKDDCYLNSEIENINPKTIHQLCKLSDVEVVNVENIFQAYENDSFSGGVFKIFAQTLLEIEEIDKILIIKKPKGEL